VPTHVGASIGAAEGGVDGSRGAAGELGWRRSGVVGLVWREAGGARNVRLEAEGVRIEWCEAVGVPNISLEAGVVLHVLWKNGGALREASVVLVW